MVDHSDHLADPVVKAALEAMKTAEAAVVAARQSFTDAVSAFRRRKPLLDRMVFAARTRCPCGAGLAYDPEFEDPTSPFKGAMSGFWDCSAIMLGTADPDVQHSGRMPFSFWEIKSEDQPSADGATTRPPKAAA